MRVILYILLEKRRSRKLVFFNAVIARLSIAEVICKKSLRNILHLNIKFLHDAMRVIACALYFASTPHFACTLNSIIFIGFCIIIRVIEFIRVLAMGVENTYLYRNMLRVVFNFVSSVRYLIFVCCTVWI